MACHWQTFKDRDGVEHTVHFNIAKPRRRKCAHCACPDAKALCDWKMVKPVRFSEWGSVDVGDTLVQASGWRARILSIEPTFPGAGQFYVTVRALVLISGLNKLIVKPFETLFHLGDHNLSLFRVERPATCDKPCCFRCRRHVDKNVDYCMDHWDAMMGEPLGS